MDNRFTPQPLLNVQGNFALGEHTTPSLYTPPIYLPSCSLLLQIYLFIRCQYPPLQFLCFHPLLNLSPHYFASTKPSPSVVLRRFADPAYCLGDWIWVFSLMGRQTPGLHRYRTDLSLPLPLPAIPGRKKLHSLFSTSHKWPTTAPGPPTPTLPSSHPPLASRCEPRGGDGGEGGEGGLRPDPPHFLEAAPLPSSLQVFFFHPSLGYLHGLPAWTWPPAHVNYPIFCYLNTSIPR